MAGRAWQAAQQVATSVSTGGNFLEVDDEGRAVLVTSIVTATNNFPFTVTTPSVLLGTPGSQGPGSWTQPISIASFGARSGAPAPTSLRVEDLQVAPNGRAVLLVTGLGGGCPADTPGQSTWCYFVAQMDPLQRTWTPLDPVIRYNDPNSPGSFSIDMNSRGDIAAFFEFTGFSGVSSTVVWRGAAASNFQSTAVGPTARQFRNSRITVDEAGGIVFAGGTVQGGTTDITVRRGSVATGLQPAQTVDGRTSPAEFRWLWTGRSGKSFLLWVQDNGTTRSLWGARFDPGTPTIVAEDLGPPLITVLGIGQTLLSDALEGQVSDADELIFRRYNGNPRDGSTCSTFRWAYASAPRLIDTTSACSMQQVGILGSSSSGAVTERGGNMLGVDFASGWGTYDAALNAQVTPFPSSPLTLGTGPAYVYGIAGLSGRAPSGQVMALSRSGVAVFAVSAALDVWPTPAMPSGDGRPSVRNLWTFYFR